MSMHNTQLVTKTNPAEKIFDALLLLYPEHYRKQFGKEMKIVFYDMYQEELARHGSVGIRFWISCISDCIKSVVEQHITEIHKKGMKRYLQQTLHINKYNIIGGIFLLPFMTLLFLDVMGRILQGDLVHYNRAWYAAITHSVLYKEPFIIKTIFIYAPVIAIIINVIPFLRSLQTINKPTIYKLLFANLFSFIILGMGLFFLVIIYGHDVVPCMAHGLQIKGITNIQTIISVCRNA